MNSPQAPRNEPKSPQADVMTPMMRKQKEMIPGMSDNLVYFLAVVALIMLYCLMTSNSGSSSGGVVKNAACAAQDAAEEVGSAFGKLLGFGRRR
jgi:hypothetical protein